jgi:hypothetical protein
MEPMDTKIRSVIKKFSYPVWFVLRDQNTNCTCVDFTTKQPDPKCKRCLGTGKKIKLVRVNAAHQNEDISMRGDGLGYGEKVVAGNYYTLTEVDASPEDIIVDGSDVDVLQHIYSERTNSTNPIYYKHSTAPMKSNTMTFLKNFKEVLKNAGYSN